MLSLSLRDALLTSTIVAGACLIAVPASAQSNQGSSTTTQTPQGPGEEAASTSGVLSPDQQAASEEGVGQLGDQFSDQTVVTGSLVRNNVDAIPVVSVSAQTIELKQANTAEELLRDLPGMTPNIGSAVNNGNGGSSYLDLYNLGRQRNLVLLDGRRIAPASTDGAVDLNNIPTFLVKRIDTLTGGASTTYGADAMAGVVNFVMRNDFTGFSAEAANQISQSGDGQTYRIDVATGAALDDNRGNVTFSLGYQNSKPIYQSDRGFSYQAYSPFTDSVTGSGTATPGQFTLDGGGSETAFPGQINGLRQIDPALGAVRKTYQKFNYNPYNALKVPFRRWNMLAYGRYELSKNIEAYSRGLYSNNEVKTIVAPSGSFGQSVRIPLSNPYMPSGIRNQFCKNNDFDPNTPDIQTLTQAQCDAAATATDPNDPNFRAVSTDFYRRNSEGGPRIATYTTHYYDLLGGFRGKLFDDVNWDLSGSYGRSDKHNQTSGYWVNSRIAKSLWATNKNTCLAPGGGAPSGSDPVDCVPLDAFGANGSITPTMLGYLSDDGQTRTKTNEIQVIGVISGDTKFNLPWTDRPIGFAAGADYRRERGGFTADSLSRSGELSGAGAKSLESHGGYRTYEGFGELNLPIASDRKFLRELSVNAGLRYSGYRIEGEGRKMHSWTYKGEGNWKPVDALMIRGNYTRAVRAPNIDELFYPVNTGLETIDEDPCAGEAPKNNANLGDLCVAQGAPRYKLGSIANPSAGQGNLTTGGNVNLKPERSDSWGVGAVIAPPAWGFSLTVDYYHIKIKRMISRPTVGDVLGGCYTGTYTADQYQTNIWCRSIGRNPSTGGLDGNQNVTPGVITQLGNLGRQMTDGINVQATFRRNITDKIRFDYSNIFNWTHRSKYQATSRSINRECVGYYSTDCSSIQPKINMTNRFSFSSKRWLLSLSWRYLHKAKYEPIAYEAHGGDAAGLNKNYFRIKAQNNFDLSGQVMPDDHLVLTLAITNLTNKKPPFVGTSIGTTEQNNGNTYPSSYDSIGRMFRMSAKVNF